ncbi:hypothetical protein S83_068852 [Arachis hypogaea]
MAERVEGFNFEQRHGKKRVRVARVWKTKENTTLWSGESASASSLIVSTLIVATETMKNTVTFFFLSSFVLLNNE